MVLGNKMTQAHENPRVDESPVLLPYTGSAPAEDGGDSQGAGGGEAVNSAVGGFCCHKQNCILLFKP